MPASLYSWICARFSCMDEMDWDHQLNSKQPLKEFYTNMYNYMTNLKERNICHMVSSRHLYLRCDFPSCCLWEVVYLKFLLVLAEDLFLFLDHHLFIGTPGDVVQLGVQLLGQLLCNRATLFECQKETVVNLSTIRGSSIIWNATLRMFYYFSK